MPDDIISHGSTPSRQFPDAGDVRRGTVTSVEDFGVFVDLGDCEGLVDKLEVSWARFSHPNEVVDVGADVATLVLGTRRVDGHLALSLKGLQPDPLQEFGRTYIDRATVATVSRVTPIGVFARVAEGLEGLIVAADSQVAAPASQHWEVGDEVTVKVRSINLKTRQITLSVIDEP
ncbi:S1 RNA-binding domain-containing protein [Streptomyces albus]|uniref:S1 RNA-binding domain-containing protein n=1 Tax=Streptomyces albus TaxID=1888 RepID=UPI0006E1387D|nr:S1 RNA-binding domain-containing protein [Streptomyces albus]